MRHAGRQVGHVDVAAPVALDDFVQMLTVFTGRGPRILRIAEAAGECAERDERCRPLRVSRGEQDRHAGPFRVAEERGALRTNGVHHRAHVVHSLLQRGKIGIGDSIRHPGASLVEKNQTAE